MQDLIGISLQVCFSGFDLIEGKFGIYAAPLVMIGSSAFIPGIGFGIALFRRLGLGIIVPFWMFGVIVPPIVALIASGIVGVVLLVAVAALLIGLALWIKRRLE